MSFPASKYRDAARLANAHLDMRASLDKVYADPACRSLLRALADDDVIDDAVGDNRVHVERVLSYFQTSNAPEQPPSRKAQKNTSPCGPCSISRVKCSPVNGLVDRFPCQRCQKRSTLASCKPKSDSSNNANAPTVKDAASSTTRSSFTQSSAQELSPFTTNMFSGDAQASRMHAFVPSIPANLSNTSEHIAQFNNFQATPNFQPQVVDNYADNSYSMASMPVETCFNSQPPVIDTRVHGSTSEDLPTSWLFQANSAFPSSHAD